MPSASARDILITQAEFPDPSSGYFRVDAGVRTPPTTASDSPTAYSPAECKKLVRPGSESFGVDQAQIIQRENSDQSSPGAQYIASVEKSTDSVFSGGIEKLLAKCRTVTMDRTITFSTAISIKTHVTYTITTIDIGGVDGSHVALDIASTFSDPDDPGKAPSKGDWHFLIGLDRGMTFLVSYLSDSETTSASADAKLATLFNKQRQKIRSAA